MGLRSTVVIATVVPVAACRDAHHACKVRVENLSESLTAVRRFLYFFAILAPSSEESDGCVFVGRERCGSIEQGRYLWNGGLFDKAGNKKSII